MTDTDGIVVERNLTVPAGDHRRHPPDKGRTPVARIGYLVLETEMIPNQAFEIRSCWAFGSAPLQYTQYGTRVRSPIQLGGVAEPEPG